MAENITVIVTPPAITVATKVSSGVPGPAGPVSFVAGLEAEKSAYDTALDGLVYLATDTKLFYVKDSTQPSGWSDPYTMGGGDVTDESLRRNFLV